MRFLRGKEMRINKYIASSGFCSRRGAEEYIKNGKVRINGKVVTDLATDVNEENDTVVVDGQKVEPVSHYVYLMFHKPKGCVCTLKDEKGRKTVMDFFKDFTSKRIFPVGRLDYDTEGLLLLTNDGNLANMLTQPSADVPKTYSVKIEGNLSESELATLRNGMTIDGIKLKKSKISVKEQDEKFTKLDVTIFEGKNRQIHRMFETLGKNVVFLKRTQIGDLKLGGLTRGTYRFLTGKEISKLFELC